MATIIHEEVLEPNELYIFTMSTFIGHILPQSYVDAQGMFHVFYYNDVNYPQSEIPLMIDEVEFNTELPYYGYSTVILDPANEKTYFLRYAWEEYWALQEEN